MNKPWKILAVLAVLLTAASLNLSAQPDDALALAADSLGLPQVDPMDVPVAGSTCWWVLPGGSTVPMPFLPADSSGGIWEIAPQVFVVDDSGGQPPAKPRRFGLPANATAASAVAAEVQNLIDQITQIQTTAALQQARAMGLAADLPGFGDSGTNGDIPGGLISARPDYGTNLFLAMNAATNGVLSLVLSNTVYTGTGEVYAVMSAADLTSGWNVTTQVWAVSNQNWIAFTVPMSSPTNLFVWAKDWTGDTTNGVPSWWSFYWYGNLTNTLDSSGYSLLGDYQDGTDPNVISFSVRLGNRYFNTSFASGQYAVSAGIPSYEAVLVNDTNFNDAAWRPYDGTVSMSLGSTDGVYHVWLGLKGYASNATPTWVGTTVYLDRTAPVVNIANPVAGSVALPYIQLQGFGNERLAGVTYEVSNALGVVTGQAGLVTGEFLDTNLLAFTTNYFSCLDVWLTNGLNVITVYATDLAGNVGSTSVSYTQDYSGKTNPPAIQLDWPADGMQIGQNTMTMCGTLDDPTAAISLLVTDDAGDTNVLAGVVERDGHYWIQNVPLAGTTDDLTLTVQDVQSNIATMSLTVYPANDAGLTMAQVTGDLWASFATVCGTIGDPSYAVTVNGVLAINNGNGTWTAHLVPISPGHMAVFTAVASEAKSSDARPNGWLLFNPEMAVPGDPVNVQCTAVKPAAVKLEAAIFSDEIHSVPDVPPYFGLGFGVDNKTAWSWKAGKGGSYAQTIQISGDDNYTMWWSAALPADFSPPYMHYTASYGNEIVYLCSSCTGPWLNDFPQEVGSLTAICPAWPDWWEQRSGEASWVLHAGNLGISGGPNPESLMVLSAHATGEEQGTSSDNWGRIQDGAGVSGPEIVNTGLPEDTNCQVAFLMPDGTDQQSAVTTDRPLVSVNNGVVQYKPVISWVNGPVITNTQNVIVGQQISLSCALVGLPGSTPPPITNYSWTVPGMTFSNYVVAGSMGILYTNFCTTSNSVTYYWIDNGVSRQVQCTVVALGQTNSAMAEFDVKRPSIDWIGTIQGAVAADNNYKYERRAVNVYLHFGGSLDTNGNVTEGIVFAANNLDTNFPGSTFSVTQIGMRTSTLCNSETNSVTTTATGLDGGATYFDFTTNSIGTFEDSPGSPTYNSSIKITLSDSFDDYLMFQPPQPSKRVPLKRVSWGWSGGAVPNTSQPGWWSLISSNAAISANNTDTFSFPEWTNLMDNFSYKTNNTCPQSQ